MIKLFRSVFFMILLFCLSSPLYGQGSSGAILEKISFEKMGDNGETITFELNDSRVPKMFSIKGEKPRLVFDFFDTLSSKLLHQKINTKGSLIQRIRVGVHHKPKLKTRVVVDLFPGKQVEVDKKLNEKENTLVVKVFQVGSDLEIKKDLKTKQQKVVPKDVPAEVVMKKESRKEKKKESRKDKKKESRKDKKESVAPEGSSTKNIGSQNVAATSEKPAAKKPEQPSVQGKIAATPYLSEVTFENTSNKGEMVLFKLNDFYPPIVFGLEKGDPRVVCDFLGTTLSKDVKKVINSNGKFVRRIRLAKHKNPDKIRVVLDLTPNSNYDLQQVFFKEDNLFVIIINPFSEVDKNEAPK